MSAPIVLFFTLIAAQQAAPGAGLVVGQVLEAGSTRPVAGAIVTMRGPMSPPRVLTGTDGRFVFRDLPRGSFSITATKAGHAEGAHGRRRPDGPSQQIALVESERIGDVVVRMWKLAAITGTVIDEVGEPLVGVQIRPFRRTIVSGRARFVSGPVAITDDRGVYRAGNLVPGQYVVGASARHIAVPMPPPGEPMTRWLPTAGELPLSAPLPGGAGSIQVGDFVYGLGRGAPIPPSPVDDRLLIYPPAFYPSATGLMEATVIDLAAGEDRVAIDLQLRPTYTVRVSGIVFGPDGPAEHTVVRLLPANPDDVGLTQDSPATVTDRNGGFTFPAIPTGQYVLRVATSPMAPRNAGAQPEASLWAELPLSVGLTDIANLAVSLQNGIRIIGRLEFDGSAPRPAGSRLQQIPVMVEPANAMSDVVVPSPPTRVDANGEFTTVGFPAGKYFVRIGGSPTGWMFKSATYNGQDIADLPLELQGGDAKGVVVTFTDRWTGLRGVVRTARGTPDADAIVLIFPADSQSWTDYGINVRRVRSVRTNKYGEYSLHSLPVGDYYVTAVADEKAAGWQDAGFLQALTGAAARIRIGDGEQRTQDLRTREVK